VGKEFETRLDAEVPATPEQVWDAIATGPGISSWFVGRTEVDGATVRTSFGDGLIPPGAVTVAEEPARFAYGSPEAPDGRFVAYEYLIEARDNAATVLRTVTSGFLPGDDWAAEYEAMQYGTALYFATLVEYLRFFPGRPADVVTVIGPPVDDWDAAWTRLRAGLDIDGTVYFENPHTLGIRTGGAFFRFIRGLHGGWVASHVLFTPDPGAQAFWTAFIEDLS
jgi:uncharacterized protein YndB with AHSA1/START domain